MPELPEVETMCRGIAGVVGLPIAAVDFARRTRRPLTIEPAAGRLAGRLVGRRIAAISRAGKRVVLQLDLESQTGAERLVIEPRMTGLLLRVPPPSETHVRMTMHFAAAVPPLIFWDRRGLGTIRLLAAADFARRCGPPAVGPDSLTLRGPELATAIRGSRRSIKQALLDQRVTAGIGNIYAAEILFAAGIDPRSRCCRLSRDACAAIAAAGRSILRRAIRLEGSSIGDETYRTADSRPGRYQRCHQVYGRADQACFRCGAAIRRIIQAQRSTFFCPGCQRRR